MTDILCRWLNEDVHLEPKLSSSSFAEQFSNGYLFGEVLHKHGLQNNFGHFSRGTSSEAKLNNFMMLEPTFKLLDIPFDVNMARDIMTEKPGVATKLMYQLFISLNRKKQRKLTGQSIECMRPSGKMKLEKIETGIFQERLKHRTPRQVDLNFEGLISRFQERQKQHEETMARERQAEEERLQHQRKDLCHQSLEKSKQVRERQAQLYAKLKPISGTTTKPSATTTISPDNKQTHAKRSRVRTRLIAAQTRASIDEFEASISKRMAPPTSDGEPRPFTTGSTPDDGSKDTGMIQTTRQVMTADYVSDIKRRVRDGNAARNEREKRRRKVLVDQMKALQEQENIKREKMLVERLMRQCQQERRIATQLMNIRKEKDVIRNNRITREKQYEEQRMREFEEALNREAELARQEENAKNEMLKFHQQLYRNNLILKSREHYQRTYHVCQIMLLHMVDFATKLSRYREMTQGLVPAKLVSDWKALFIAGLPLDDGEDEKNLANLSSLFSSQMTTGSITSFKPQTTDQLLNDTDFNEYKTSTVEWAPTDDLANELPSPTNTILAHAVYRALDTVDPPRDGQKASYLPNFLLRSAIVGRPFSGKTTVFQHLKKACGIYVLSTDELVQKAINTYLTEKRIHDDEYISVPTEEATPIIPGDNEGAAPVINDGGNPGIDNNLQPTVSMEPSSSVQMMMSSTNLGTSPDVKAPEQKDDDVNGLKSTSAVSVDVITQYSPMAQLGFKAHSLMLTGEPLDDPLLVEIIIQEMKSLPENSMWMLDNFPCSLDQGMTMTMALTGTTSRPKSTLPREFELLGERDPEMMNFRTVDMIFHFDCSVENVMKRAIEQDPSPSSQKLHHLEQRIATFDENWKPLKRLINKYKACKTIDANRDIKTVCKEMEGIIRDIINRAKIAEAMKKIGGVSLSGSTATGSTCDLSAVPTSKSDPTVTTSKPVKPASRKRRPSSAEGIGVFRKLGVATVAGTHPDDKNATAPDIPGPSSNVEPGSPGWKYCDLPLCMELAEGVAKRWPAIEETYITTLKSVFHLLRGEKECIYRYYHQRRTEFATYLHRPDQKQEFVTQWQINYNSLSVHLRWEGDMKAELHHRVDDLCDKLWDICDHRREQAEQERQRIVGDKWIEDHVGLLTNQYISMMQIELDRFQDTLLLLNDYYDAMDAKMPSALPENSRLPLIQLTPANPMDVPPSAVSSAQSIQQISETEEQDQQEETKKEVNERPKTGGRPKTGQREPSTPKRKVPILPRKPPSQDPVEDKGAKKKGPPSPQPPVEELSGLELDEQLVIHAYNTAIAGIFHLVQPMIKNLEATITTGNRSSSPKSSEPAEKPSMEPIKEEKPGKGKNAKKAKSPAAGKKNKASPGKAGKGAPPPDPAPEVPAATTVIPNRNNSMDATRRRQRILMSREHKAAVEMEEKRAKLQIQLIKSKALLQIENIKSKGQSMHKDMEQWIDKCYKQEVAGVNNLADVLRQAIENEEKIPNELKLGGVHFQIEQSIMMYEPSPPTPTPPPIEKPSADQFTVNQLMSLYHQLVGVAPSGYIMMKSLVETMMNFADKAAGGDMLPEEWKTMSREQVELFCESVFSAGVDFVDWRRFMVCLAQPWPVPTARQLVEAMQVFADKSGGGKCVTREQYETARIWLDSGRGQVADGEYDRNTAMKQLFYEVFSDPNTNQLNYKTMLLYLAADPQPNKGIIKALSIAVGRDLSLEHELNDPNVVILLENLYQVLTHCVRKESSTESRTVVTKSELLNEVFLPLNPSYPNEIPLNALLTHSTALHYITSSSIDYTLPGLSQILRPPSSRQTETEQ